MKYALIIVNALIVCALLLVLYNSIRFYKAIYKRKTTIKNKLLRVLVSVFLSIIYGILVIFGSPYMDETDF